MFLHQPLTTLATLVISFLVLIIVKILGKVMFIYGRRRMVISVLLGFIFGWFARTYGLFDFFPSNYAISVIGFIIPGLIANAMEKQGILKTLIILTVGAVIVRFLIIIIFNGQIIN